MRQDEYDDDEPEDYDEHDDERGTILVHHEDATPPAAGVGRGCLPVLLVLVVLGAVAWFGGRFAYDEISSRLAPAPDYAGPGSGSVLYEVKERRHLRRHRPRAEVQGRRQERRRLQRGRPRATTSPATSRSATTS